MTRNNRHQNGASSALAVLPADLDPEFQRVYDEANGIVEPVAHDAEVIGKDEPTEDGFQSFARIAKKQEAQIAQRPKAEHGTFDHFEQGVENTLRLGFEWLTR